MSGSNVQAWQRIESHADRSGVTGGFAQIASCLQRSGRLLDAENTFLAENAPQPQDSGVTSDAPAYFASCSVGHLFDGWSFLGRSYSALLRGDATAAIHCGYYAELRAALALLPSQGILVTRNNHLYALGRDGSLVHEAAAGAGTHAHTWRLFGLWSHAARSLDLVGSVIAPGNVPLEVWLSAAQLAYGVSPLAQAQKVLQQWAIDGARMAKDKDRRGLMSYNPSEFLASRPFDAEAYIADCWELMEPDPASRFGRVDDGLLRVLCEGWAGEDEIADNADEITRRLFDQVGAPRQLAAAAPDLVRFALDDGVEPWHVLSRACLLLRLATGAVTQAMAVGGVDCSDMVDWGLRLAAERRLTDSADDIELLDLWADIDVALQDRASAASLGMPRDAPLRQLETTERVAIWALAA